jgi:hypothetical protein
MAREQAESKNYSKEMILPAKHIAPIVKGISAGLEALHHNRRLPERTIQQHGRLFIQYLPTTRHRRGEKSAHPHRYAG